jgi:hypothetical protein
MVKKRVALPDSSDADEPEDDENYNPDPDYESSRNLSDVDNVCVLHVSV